MAVEDASVGFHLDELPGIEEYLSAASDIAFVSGSQQVGLGNSASDFDLYIVYRDELQRLREGPKQFWLQDPPRRVDMERHGWDAIATAAARVNAVGEADPAVAGQLPFEVFDLYFRTAVGTPLQNDAGFHDLLSLLDTVHYCRVFSAWSLWQAGSGLADAAGLLARGRTEAAWLTARLALRHAVTGHLAGLGHGWPNPKWAFVKLANHYGRQSAEYRRAWALNSLAGREVAAYLDDVRAFATSLGVPVIETLPVTAAVYRWRGEALLTSIGGQTYLVQAAIGVYALDEPARFVCERIDGETAVDGIAGLYADSFRLPPGEALEATEGLLSRLGAAGLIELTARGAS